MVVPGRGVKPRSTDVPSRLHGSVEPCQSGVVGRVPKLAALDLGKARVGVAVADDLGLYAHARPPFDGRNRKALLAALGALAREEGITRFLVGLPLALSGDEGPAARRALAFAEELAAATGVEVELVDERLTTVQADRELAASGRSRKESRGQVDGVAAAILLQARLDAGRAREDPEIE